MLHITNNHWKNRFIPWLLTILVFTSALVPAFGQEILLHEEIEGFPITGGVTLKQISCLLLRVGKNPCFEADLTSKM